MASAAHEQDVWSNRTSTPSVKSPEQIQYQILETNDLINEPYRVTKTATGTLEDLHREAKALRQEMQDEAIKYMN
jgi:purine nucleoside permease